MSVIQLYRSRSTSKPLIFSSSSDDSARFEIQVKHRSSWFSDSCIGVVSAQLSDLKAQCANGESSSHPFSYTALARLTRNLLSLFKPLGARDYERSGHGPYLSAFRRIYGDEECGKECERSC